MWVAPGELLFVEIHRQRVSRFRSGACETVAITGGGPNGLARGSDGSIFVANNGGLTVGPEGYWRAPDAFPGCVQRIAPDGTLASIVPAFPAPVPRPNDICVGPDGRLYFTDPHNWDDLANLGPGRVWRSERDGADLTLLAEVPMFPNGIGFGPDGALYVAQSILQRVIRFPVADAGLGEPSDFAALPTGFPDGLCFAADGRLFVCGSMGHVLHVFDGDGAHMEEIAFPDGSEPTNCCIGDGLLYVTLSGSGELAALERDVEPLPLFG